MDFSANLRRLRKAAKLTQEELALRCGWGQSRIGNYEAPADKDHAREPELKEIPIIAAALQVGVGELFGEPPSQSQPLRLDREIVRDVAAVLDDEFKKLGGGPYEIAKNPELFELLYERGATIDRDVRSPDNMLQLGREMGRLGIEGGSGDERSKKVPSKRLPKGNTGGGRV